MRLNVTSILTSFEPLSTSQRRAAIVVVVFSLLSTLAFAFIALRTIRDATVLFLNRGNRTSRPPEILFFRTQLGHYAGCLILSNVFISAAGLINFSWLSHSGLSRGLTCSTQAVLMQIGLWGTCWFTAAHGVHTLISLVFRVHQAHWCGVATVSIGWTIAFVAALAPMQKSNVYGPTGISCGIAHSYPKEIISLGALPIVIGAFVSTAVYSVTFVVLHGKQSANSTQKLRGLSSASRRGEDAPEEYHKFISMIIWTMFWFPLAFVLLLSPFCIIYILLYAGYSVPFAPSVFADVCASMLGLVNVGLLCNTFRVISPMSRAAKVAAETVMTFGHDASGESPTVPQFNFHPKSAIPSHESHRTYNSTQTSLNHSHNSSLSSVDSTTGLIGAEKAPYKSIKTKVVPLGLHIIPPAELGRQFDGEPGITSLHSNTKSQDPDAQVVMIDSPLRTVNLSPCPPRVVCWTEDTGHEPWTQDEKCSFKLVADTDTFGEVTKELPLTSKASLAPNSPSLSVVPLPILPLDVTNKSAALATRLGIPVTSADIPSQTPAVSSTQMPDARAPAFPITLVPQLETNLWSPENADESNRHFSTSSYASTATLSTVCGSDCSGEIMYVYKIQPHSQGPQPNDDEEDKDTVGSFPLDLQRRSAWCRRVTRASVWSQESGYTMNQSPDEESQEAYWHVIADLLDPRVMSDDQANVVGVMSRRVTLARPQTLRIQPSKVVSECSVRFSDTLSPESPNSKPSTTIFAPNDSVV